MKRSTWLHSVLTLISLNLLWMSTPVLAQHGGGHGGGGGGGHAAGDGGGFHGGGGSYGGVHGGGYSGGYNGGSHGGGYSGGYSGGSHGGSTGAYSRRGSSGGAALGERSSSAGHPWSWEGHSSRDTSPGWHQFPSGSGSGMGRSAGGSMAARSGESTIARAGNQSSHAAVADGNWHSFNASNHVASSTIVSNTHVVTVTHPTFVSSGFGWHGGWGGGFGWGWPGWNWGFGWGWGWGFGFGFGWGWGWGGPGWAAWGPFWAWPSYYYSPWLDDSWLSVNTAPAPYVLYPYPA